MGQEFEAFMKIREWKKLIEGDEPQNPNDVCVFDAK